MLKPMKLGAVDSAFGGNTDRLLPKYEDIPEEFKSDHNVWVEMISTWFFLGLPKDTQFVPQDGIDPKEALLHVAACLKSFQPKQEHKTAGCAYLMSLWFKDVLIDGKDLNARNEERKARFRKALGLDK